LHSRNKLAYRDARRTNYCRHGRWKSSARDILLICRSKEIEGCRCLKGQQDAKSNERRRFGVHAPDGGYTLRQGGFEVVEFEDGQDALNKLQRATVDLIITDLPALADMDPAQCYLSWAVELASPCAEAELREVFEFVEHLAEIRITRAKVPQLPVNALSTLLVATAVEALVPEPEQEHVNAPARRKTAAKKPDASGAALLQS